MTRYEQEASCIGSDVLVLRDGGLQAIDAGGVGPFTDEVGDVGVEPFRALHDPLVDVAEECFGMRDLELAFAHVRLPSIFVRAR